MTAARRRREEDPDALAERVLAGDRRAVARAISLAEDEHPGARRVLEILYPHAGKARTLGITGPPGVGKSSLIAALCTLLRAREQTIGVITVDPSSHITHGALLGDRIRLVEHFLDSGVYIRSMGTRGHLGGVAEATLLAGVIVDASGRDVLLYETVGVGQSEVEVAGLADTVALVLMPGSGDSIQALKAGVMEIPDVIVVNKADHPAIERTRAELAQVLSLADPERRPVVRRDRRHRAERHRGAVGRGRGSISAALADGGDLAERRKAQLRSELLALAVGALGAQAGRGCSTAAPSSRGSSTRWPSAASTRSRPCSSCSSAHDDPRGRLRLPPHARTAARAARSGAARCSRRSAEHARERRRARSSGACSTRASRGRRPRSGASMRRRTVARAYFDATARGGRDRRRRSAGCARASRGGRGLRRHHPSRQPRALSRDARRC